MNAPRAQVATRGDEAPAKGRGGGLSRSETLARAARAAARQEREKVFYNSAKAPRTLLGHVHYCLACPGWNKATDTRVVYSRWELAKVPCGIGYCFGITYPVGRQLDSYDAQIISDISAHQTLLQICRGEGDIVIHRLQGGDLSHDGEVMVMSDVPAVFDVFNDMTFELAKVNLKSLASKGLGRLMGAVTYDFDARSAADGQPERHIDPNAELTYYDSRTAKRTLIGRLFQLDCCLPPVYKITSERVMYTEWDVWHMCDEPTDLCYLPILPGLCLRECILDCCGCLANNRTWPLPKTEEQLDAAIRAAKNRGCIARWCCALPLGRTAHFFDMDIVADVGAHQNLTQLCINEGDLLVYRLAGGDASAREDDVFVVRSVPEVFNQFDELSFEFAKMDLSHYRQSAIGQEMLGGRR